MAKKNQDEGLVDVGQVYSKSEDFVNKNGKMLTLLIGALVVGFVGYFLYNTFVVDKNNKDAEAKIWKAQYFFGLDSLGLAVDGNDEYYGFQEIADDFGGTPSGKLAKYYTGVIRLKQGQFQEAINYLSDCSFDNMPMEAIRLGSIGDANVELNKLGAAIDYFEKAANYESNDLTSPIYLKKLGLAYEANGNKDAALETYKRLKRDYKNSAEGRSIDKYIGLLE